MLRLVAALLLALSPPASAGERLAGRARVTDGDTLKVGGVPVRLKGLAAPEVAHSGDPGEPGGVEAKAFMVELVEGETVVVTSPRSAPTAGGWVVLPRRPGHRRGAGQGRAGARLPSVLGWPVRGGRDASSTRAAVSGILPAEVAQPCAGMLSR